MSTGKQLQGLGTSSSYKLCRKIVIVGNEWILSKKGALEGTLSRKENLKKKLEVKTWLKHKGQPFLNRQNSKWISKLWGIFRRAAMSENLRT